MIQSHKMNVKKKLDEMTDLFFYASLYLNNYISVS